MQFDESRPIYRQIVEAIRRRIAGGSLRPGERLPSVREAALSFKVNPNTVQRAFQELEREGITDARRGQGSFVSESPGLVEQLRTQLADDAVDRCLQELDSLGITGERALQLFKQALADPSRIRKEPRE